MGNGPINFDWNQRYFVLDKENNKMSYFLKETDKKARGLIELSNAKITNVMPIKGRKYCFWIKLNQGKGREFNLSANDLDTANLWISMIDSWIQGDDKLEENGDKVVQEEFDINDDIKNRDSDTKFSNTQTFKEKFKQRITQTRSTRVTKRKTRATEYVREDSKNGLSSAAPTFEQTLNEKEDIANADFGDVSGLSNEFKTQFENIDKYLSEEDLFKLLKYDKSSRVMIYKKEKPYQMNKANKKLWGIALVVSVLLWFLFDWWVFNYAIIGAFIYLVIQKPLISKKDTPYVYKSWNIVDFSSTHVFEYLKLHYRKELKISSGRLIKNMKETGNNPEKHLTNYNFQFERSFNDIWSMNQKPTQAKAQQYWCISNNDTKFIFTQIEEMTDKKSVKYEEAFVIINIPYQADKCMVYFFTNLGCPDGFVYENITLMSIKEHNEYDGEIDEDIDASSMDKQIISRAVAYSGVKSKINLMPTSSMYNSAARTEDDVKIILDKRFSSGYGNAVRGHHHQVRKLPEHPNNLRLQKGVTMGISERFIGYFRLEDGLLWCNNHDELDLQKGIVLELLQRAGEKVMKGQGVVSISLPVRIFEPRSTLERCGDLWTTGPKYLTLAGQTSNSIERFKFVMCFMISSMYMVWRQLKPFNPILGETFQGYWPDGTQIYIEHISHHPPISWYLVEHADGLYKYEGSYEYTAKLTNLGNSARGRHVGPNRIYFKDGSMIEYQYPFIKINGLLMGKRTMKWEGDFEFVDKLNNISCQMKFPQEGIFGLKGNNTYDQLSGTIIKDGENVCEVEGSWLSHLSFNKKKYWELESSDIILPMRAESCLPSDCRYREDSVALGNRDLDLAQEEKERLIFQVSSYYSQL